MLDVEFAQYSDPGRSRDHNEDYLGHAEPESATRARSHGWLFALADGVGGHDWGEVASRTAVEHIVHGFKKAPANQPLGTLLTKLVQNANIQVYETGRQASPGGTAMATTLVACALRYDRVVVAHAGDSRCYLIRNSHATLLTRDHTYANEQVKLGILSAKDVETASTRHLLVRSLGQDLFVTPELSDHQILAGDVLVLCCDGLHHSVKGSEMASIAGHGAQLKDAAQQLVDLANERDGSDNISVLIVRVRDVERIGMYRGRPYQLK